VRRRIGDEVTQTFVASSRQSASFVALRAAATASGPSPPPCAESVPSERRISSSDAVNGKERVTKVMSCGGWSR